jgi:putative endonuclease
MKVLNKRSIGTRYEEKAVQYLLQQGYQILERNYRCRQGEIDLIARDGTYLVFLEVKYRHDLRAGYGYEAVDYRKQQRILHSALWYMRQHRIPENQPCRFDVVSFLGEEVTLIKNAFEYS